MTIQIHNAERRELLSSDRRRGIDYPYSLGRLGIYNGQFTEGEIGANPWPDGWEFHPNAGQSIARTNADSIAGAHCVEGGTDAIGGTAPGYMLQQKLMPVSTIGTYVFRVSLKAVDGVTTIRFGAYCYNAAKAFLGSAVAYNAAPGNVWVRVTQNMGAAGTAFVANTRWMRFWVDWNDTTANTWVRVDDIYLEA